MKNEKKKRVKRRVGDLIAIPLESGYAYGRVLRMPLVAFYDLKSKNLLPPEKVLPAPIAFRILVMNRPIVDGSWPVLGNFDLEARFMVETHFLRRILLQEH